MKNWMMNYSIRDMSNYQPTDDVATTLYTAKKPHLMLVLIGIIVSLAVSLLLPKMKKSSKHKTKQTEQQKGVKNK